IPATTTGAARNTTRVDERRPNGHAGRAARAALPSFGKPPPNASMSVLDRLRWYRNRLASMSAAEVAHRLAEQRKRAWSRRRQPPFPEDAPARLPALPALLEALRREPPPAALLRDWREVAERAQSGRFRFLGVEWPGGGAAPSWHLDPVSGRAWPAERYCFAIAHRHAPGMGDIKYAWELNRLQYL